MDLKALGNLAFSEKEYARALELYGRALLSVREEENGVVDGGEALRLALLSNRAACSLAMKQYEDCIRDTTEVLSANPHHTKALFRRAKAFDGVDRIADAMRDIQLATRLEPDQRQALKFARQLREKASRQRESTARFSRIEQLVQQLAGGTDEDQTLKAMASLVYNDASAACELLRCNGVATLQPLFRQQATVAWEEKKACVDDTTAVLAIKVLCALAQHSSSFSVVLPPQEEDTQTELDRCIDLPTVAALVRSEHSSADLKTQALLLLQHMATAEEASPPPPPSSSSEAAFTVGPLRNATLEAVVETVSSCDNDAVVGAAIDVLVRSCVGTPATAAASATEAGNKQPASTPSTAEKELLRESSRREVMMQRLIALGADTAILNIADSESGVVRRRIAVALGCFLCLDAYGDADDAAKEAIQRRISRLLTASEESHERQRKSCAVLSAVMLVQQELGVWVLGQEGAVARVLGLAVRDEPRGQALALEVLSSAASNEAGRALLAPVVESGALNALLQSAHTDVRALAASTLAKLGISAKALKSSSAETGQLLDVCMSMLAASGDGDSGAERGVEVLSYLVTKSAIKDEITHGSGRAVAVLARLVSLAESGSSPTAHGIAYIFSHLTVTNDLLRREAFADKDITVEQYDQLQKIAKQGGQDEEDNDTEERMRARIQRCAEAGAPRALVRLCADASEATCEVVAKALCQMATDAAVRGQMIQQGVVVCLLGLAAKGDASSCHAVHALAKILITTNPRLLPQNVPHDAVPPILRMCRNHESSNLQQFEGLMALTTLASTDDTVKDEIVQLKGIADIKYLQFSDHELVRRAAFEALVNLFPHSAVYEHLRKEDSLKLWVGFAQGYDEDAGDDVPTARAAAGGLAMLAGDAEAVDAMVENGAAELFVELADSGNPELQHRALVGICDMASHASGKSKLLEVDALPTTRRLSRSGVQQIAAAAAQAVSVLDC